MSDSAPAAPVPDGPAPIDDIDYPAYTMGTAAAMIGVQPDFLRGLGETGLLAPARSSGGHRRYSRRELLRAARARELVDAGMTLGAACRIVALEDRLAGAQAELAGTRSQLAGTRSELAGTRSELADARSELDDARSELDGARSELDGARSELDDARSELQAAQATINQLRARRNADVSHR